MKLPVVIRLSVCLISPFPLGCTSLYHADLFPETALAKVTTAVSFVQIKESPEQHQGVTLMLGGEVLEAKRFKDHTRLTVLQLPLDTSHEPTRDRTQSEGRFLGFRAEFLDPATVPKGTRLTLIGTLSGSTTEPLDETNYTYPNITIEHLKVWPENTHAPYAYYPYRYWPYGPYPYYSRPWLGPFWYY